MTRRSGSSGWTRADVLVLIGVGVFLFGLVGPLASMPRNQATRAVCRANLARIGKAMLLYADDYHEALPRAGGATTVWSEPVIWNALNRQTAYNVSVDGEGGRATISSCFYLLVKYLQTPTRMFVCPADERTREFKLANETNVSTGFELADAWDFGARPRDKCSYAYHIPFGEHGLTTSRDPNLAVAADRNPWFISPAASARCFSDFMPDVPPYTGTAETARNGNAVSHQGDGQNVLYLDGRVTFERRPFCGLDDDNIYTKSRHVTTGDALGSVPPYSMMLQPMSERDSLLVHDPDFYPSRAR